MSSKNKTQYNISVEIGVVANRPSAANVLPGSIFFSTDAPPTMCVADPATGVRAWKVLSGGGSGAWPDYVVSPPGFAPFATYTTVQSAINQAATDAHNSTHRTCVVVLPGTYVENVVLKDGIDIVGLGSQAAAELFSFAGETPWGSDCIINGNVTADAAVANVSVLNMSIVAPSGAAVALGNNAGTQTINFHNCRLENASATVATMTETANSLATIQIDLDNCQVVNTVSGGGVTSFLSPTNINSLRSSFTAFIGSDVALGWTGGNHSLQSCRIFGKIVQSTFASTDVFIDCEQLVSGSVNAITTVIAGTVTWTRGNIGGAPSPGALFTGVGAVTFKDNFTLPKYWVGPPNRYPFAPYNTIQSAINAVVADGHSVAAPASIYVMPGTYAENIVLKDGIDLVGLGGSNTMDLVNGAAGSPWGADVTLSGNITLDPAILVASITGMRLQSNTSGACLALGANASIVSLAFKNCWMSTNQATPVITGAPTGGNGTPTLFFDSCRVFNSTTRTGVAVISMTTACNIQGSLSSFQCNVGTDAAFAWTGGAHLLRNCLVFGNVTHAAAATDTFENTDLTVSGATPYFNVSAGAPTINWNRGGTRAGSTSATPYTGTFTLNDSDHGGDANSETVLSTMTMTVARTPKKLTAAATVGASVTAAQFQAAGDVVIVNTSGGAGAVALPARNLVPPGTVKYIVASPAGAFAITMTPNGTDTINGANATLATSAVVANGPSMTLIADPVTANNWLVLARS